MDSGESYVSRPSAKEAEVWAAQLAQEPEMRKLRAGRDQPRSDDLRTDKATEEYGTASSATEGVARLQAELEYERSRGFLHRLFGRTPRLSEDTEKVREQTRGRIALFLIGLLAVIVTATFVYAITLSVTGDRTTFELTTLIQGVAGTLLAPLVGLIGAVIGFYYGSQTATQAASRAAAQAATQIATENARTAPEEANVEGTQPRPPEETRITREKRRWRIAFTLILTLAGVMAATAASLIVLLSTNLDQLSTDALATGVRSVVSAIVTPLVGLVGTVVGFYYGSQTATEAATRAATGVSAAQAAAETATQAAAQAAKQIRPQ